MPEDQVKTTILAAVSAVIAVMSIHVGRGIRGGGEQ